MTNRKLTHRLLIICDLVEYLEDFRSNKYVSERIGILILKKIIGQKIKSFGYLSSASSQLIVMGDYFWELFYLLTDCYNTGKCDYVFYKLIRPIIESVSIF